MAAQRVSVGAESGGHFYTRPPDLQTTRRPKRRRWISQAICVTSPERLRVGNRDRTYGLRGPRRVCQLFVGFGAEVVVVSASYVPGQDRPAADSIQRGQLEASFCSGIS